MAQVNHKQILKLAYEERGKITDRQLFTSRSFAGHLADIGAAQTRRYNYNRRIHVKTVWEPKENWTAFMDYLNTIQINCGHPAITQLRSRAERYELNMGYFSHELGHALYTDFVMLQSFKNLLSSGGWYPKKPKARTLAERNHLREIEEYCQENMRQGEAFAEVAAHVHNVLEDGYVEERMLARFPGVLGACLKFKRDIQLKDCQTVTEAIDKEDDGEQLTFQSILGIILSYMKWGVIKYGETPKTDFRIQAVYDILGDLDYALTCEDPKSRFNVANEIMVKLWPYAKEMVEQVREQAEAMEAAGQSGGVIEVVKQMLSKMAGTSTIGAGSFTPVAEPGGSKLPGGGSTAANRAATAKEAGKKEEEEEEKETPAASEEESENNGEDKNPAGSAESEAQTVSPDETGRIPLQETHKVVTPYRGGTTRDDDYKGSGYGRQAAADVERLLENMATNRVTKRLEKERLDELNEVAKNISYGDIHADVAKVVHRMNEVDPDMMQDYQEIAPPLLAISKNLQKSLQNQLQDKVRGGKLTGLHFGPRLDRNSLARTDGKHFYKTSLPNEIPQMAVAVLLDESGSMCSCDRATYARAAAIIMYDFCHAMRIPIMVYGHSTGYDCVDLYSYAEFNTIDSKDQYRLMDISARGSNRDGAALRFVAEQLTRRREEIKILILVSDGQPADDGYIGTAAEEDLRGIKAEYSKKGIHLIAAAIGSDKERIERIYGDSFLDITDLEKFPYTITKVIKGYIRV